MGYHTWVYKRIKSLTHEQLHNEINSVIKERKSRWYTHVTSEEYAKRMKKMIKNSSLPGDSISYGISQKRHIELCQENEHIINILETAIKNNDYSVVTGNNGFSCTTSNKEFIDWLFDEPFRCYQFCDKQFTDAETLINYLLTLDPNNIVSYNYGKKVIGCTVELTDKIRKLFDDNGDGNIIIEFG